MTASITELLGSEANSLLSYKAKVSKDLLHLPGPDYVDRTMVHSDRSPQVLRSLQGIFDHGRLGGSGYLSILPVDQGIEHSAGASFAPNPIYFDPENIVKLAIEGDCNAVGLNPGRSGSSFPQVCPQDPLRGQDQPQRDLELPQLLRPDDVCQRAAGV